MSVVLSGHELTREAGSATNILAGRPFIEGHIRRRVLAIPNVTIVDGTTVRGLVAGHDGQSMAGVRLDGSVVGSDLAVIATGRAGQLPAWLEELRFTPPAEEELAVDIRYASRHLKIPGNALGNDKLVLVGAEPRRPRGMGLFAQEESTRYAVLTGVPQDRRRCLGSRGWK
jgi:hypothetical protein